jgi:hypothetical protein
MGGWYDTAAGTPPHHRAVVEGGGGDAEIGFRGLSGSDGSNCR